MSSKSSLSNLRGNTARKSTARLQLRSASNEINTDKNPALAKIKKEGPEDEIKVMIRLIFRIIYYDSYRISSDVKRSKLPLRNQKKVTNFWGLFNLVQRHELRVGRAAIGPANRRWWGKLRPRFFDKAFPRYT